MYSYLKMQKKKKLLDFNISKSTAEHPHTMTNGLQPTQPASFHVLPLQVIGRQVKVLTSEQPPLSPSASPRTESWYLPLVVPTYYNIDLKFQSINQLSHIYLDIFCYRCIAKYINQFFVRHRYVVCVSSSNSFPFLYPLEFYSHLVLPISSCVFNLKYIFFYTNLFFFCIIYICFFQPLDIDVQFIQQKLQKLCSYQNLNYTQVISCSVIYPLNFAAFTHAYIDYHNGLHYSSN